MGLLDYFKTEEGVDAEVDLNEQIDGEYIISREDLVNLINSGREEVETLEAKIEELDITVEDFEATNVELSLQLADAVKSADSGKETKFKDKKELENEVQLLKKRLARAKSTGVPRGMGR